VKGKSNDAVQIDIYLIPHFEIGD